MGEIKAKDAVPASLIGGTIDELFTQKLGKDLDAENSLNSVEYSQDCVRDIQTIGVSQPISKIGQIGAH